MWISVVRDEEDQRGGQSRLLAGALLGHALLYQGLGQIHVPLGELLCSGQRGVGCHTLPLDWRLVATAGLAA